MTAFILLNVLHILWHALLLPPLLAVVAWWRRPTSTEETPCPTP